MIKHRESKLQQACVKWFGLQYPKLKKALFAIPNGGARSETEGKILKGEGVIAGAADLFLMTIPGTFIEMKTDKGTQKPSQKEFEKTCKEMGYDYVIIRSFDEFKTLIETKFAIL